MDRTENLGEVTSTAGLAQTSRRITGLSYSHSDTPYLHLPSLSHGIFPSIILEELHLSGLCWGIRCTNDF